MHAKPLHDTKVTVRYGFTVKFIMGPYFLEQVTPQGFTTCSVNAKRYQDLLQTYVIPTLLQRGYLQETIFIQDRAPPHIASPVQQLLSRTFTDARVISRCFQIARLPRSPDLTSYDFWLWG